MNASQTSKTPYFLLINIFTPNLSLLAKVFIYTGVAFFIFSLPFVSLFTSGENLQGIWMLLIGWMGIIIFQLAWFANPLNLLAILLVTKRPILALFLSILALLLASQAFDFSEIPAGLNNEKIFIKEIGLGFYFWYLSHGLFLVGILIKAMTKTFTQAQKNED